MSGTNTQTTIVNPQPSRKKVIASAVCSALRYGSIAALSSVFVIAGMNGQLKEVALDMVSPHKFWMPATKKLAEAFTFIMLGLGATSIAEFFAKVAKNCSIKKPEEHEEVRERTKVEKAAVAVKTVFNAAIAGVSTAGAYYSVKFMGLFLKAAIALKGHHLMEALKNTGKALNMSSVFSKIFSWMGVVHAAKGLFKTCATAFHYVRRAGQDNRPSGKKLIKQSVKTALKITAAVGGLLCASVPVVGWAILGAASLVLTAWSISKIWRSKKADAQQAEVVDNASVDAKARRASSESIGSVDSVVATAVIAGKGDAVSEQRMAAANDQASAKPKVAKAHRKLPARPAKAQTPFMHHINLPGPFAASIAIPA